MAELHVIHENIYLPEDAGKWQCGACENTTFELIDNGWACCAECGKIQNEVTTVFDRDAKPEWGKQYNENE